MESLPADLILRIAGELLDDPKQVIAFLLTCKRICAVLSEAIESCLGNFATPLIRNEIWRRKRLYYFHSECLTRSPFPPETQQPLIAFDRAYVVETVLLSNVPSMKCFGLALSFRVSPPRFGRKVHIHWTKEKDAWAKTHMAEAIWVANYKSKTGIEEIWYCEIDDECKDAIWFAMGVFDMDNDGNVYYHSWNNNGLWNYRVDPNELPLVLVEPFTLPRSFLHVDGTINQIVMPPNNCYNWEEHYYTSHNKILGVYATGGPTARHAQSKIPLQKTLAYHNGKH